MAIEALQCALSRCRLVFLDTMIFSYHLSGHPHYSHLTTTILKAIESAALNGLITTLTLAELLTRPAQEENWQAMRDYEVYLTNFPNLHLASLDAAVARKAARVRAMTKLRMPDAIQIAAARVHNAEAILTIDQEWSRECVSPKIILLDDYLPPLTS